MRVVLAAFNQGDPPLDDASRDAYCSFLADAVTRFPQINDVVIWNEPNLSGFWRPQYGPPGQSAPEQYEALVAHCYDVLHGVRSSINVIARRRRSGGTTTRTRSTTSRTRRRRSSKAWEPRTGRADALRRSSTRSATTRTRPARTSARGRSTPTRRSSRSAISRDSSRRWIRRSVEPARRCSRTACRSGTSRPGTRRRSPRRRARSTSASRTGPGRCPTRVARAAGRTSAGHEPGPGSGDPARRRAAHDVLPAVRRGRFQLHARGRAVARRLAVRAALGGRHAQRVVRPLQGDGRAGEFRHGGLQSGQRCAAGADRGRGTPLRPATHRPTAASSKRSITKVTYLSSRRAAFGFVRLRARLTRGVKVSKQTMAGRQLLFVVGKTGYLATTTTQASPRSCRSRRCRSGASALRSGSRATRPTSARGSA